MATAIEDMRALRAQRAYEALPHRQRRFVDLYTVDFKIREAALQVGIAESSAHSTGHRWITEPNIALAICHVLDEKARLSRIDAAWVLKRAALLADFSIKKFVVVGEDGRPYYDFQSATDDDWYCINELTVDAIRGYVGDEGRIAVDRVKLKPYDKLKALELVARHRDVQAFEKRADGEHESRAVTEVTRRIVRPGDVAPPPAVKVYGD